jgi:hypothetical protein
MKKNKQEREKGKEEMVPKVEIAKLKTPLTFIFSGSGNGMGLECPNGAHTVWLFKDTDIKIF